MRERSTARDDLAARLSIARDAGARACVHVDLSPLPKTGTYRIRELLGYSVDGDGRARSTSA